MPRYALTVLFCLLALVLLGTAVYAVAEQQTQVYLPVVSKPEPTPTPTPTPPPPPPSMVEFRGLWVTRFNWTFPGQPMSQAQAKIDEIVNNAAYAGFNAIFFQVRGEADAFYTPGLEPWSRRLTGTLGEHPGWDPLARLIEKAHAQDIQVHAYINVYPVWTGCTPPPDGTNPRHLYYNLRDHYGTTGDRINGMQWTSSGSVPCIEYYRATPASLFVDNHLLAVARDLVQRYNVDGIHLDHIRYAELNTSCDPVSAARYGPCFSGNYADWQRAQVNGTVDKFYQEIVPLKPSLWLSAAVWPIYKQSDVGWNYPGVKEGYHTYYQDSKAWVQGGYIDSISPMIYPGSFNCPDDSFWTLERWQTLTANFQTGSGGRHIIPGIGTGYCTFDEIEARINAARTIGTAGHALFAYGSLHSQGYFERLRNGPYAQPAAPPSLPWRP
jgi:uncharacterized lipoprotein YddW (UPF0748 family)